MWKYDFSGESIKVLEKMEEKADGLIKHRIKNIGDWLDGKSTLSADIKKLKGE